MIEDMINLQKRNIESIDSNKFFPMLRWQSGDESNLNVCKDINRKFFFVDKNILLGYFVLNIKPKLASNGFVPIRYPKPKKFDNKKFDLIVSHLSKFYNYGQRDIQSLKPLIVKMLNDKQRMKDFANNFGLDNKDRKLLGVEELKFDKTKMKKSRQKSLF